MAVSLWCCRVADFALPRSKQETRRRMRSAFTGDSQEKENECDVVLLEKPKVVGLCVGVGKYDSLPQLSSVEDSRALCEALAKTPRCRGAECRDPSELNLIRFLRTHFVGISKLPPPLILLYYSGHVLREIKEGELCLLPTNFDASDLEPMEEDLYCVLTLKHLVSIWTESFQSERPRVLLLVDGCRTVVPNQGQLGKELNLPAEWSTCVCRRSGGGEAAPEGSYMHSMLMDQQEGIFAEGKSLREVLIRIRDRAPAGVMVETQLQEDILESLRPSGPVEFRSRVMEEEAVTLGEEEGNEAESVELDDAGTERQVRRRTN